MVIGKMSGTPKIDWKATAAETENLRRATFGPNPAVTGQGTAASGSAKAPAAALKSPVKAAGEPSGAGPASPGKILFDMFAGVPPKVQPAAPKAPPATPAPKSDAVLTAVTTVGENLKTLIGEVRSMGRDVKTILGLFTAVNNPEVVVNLVQAFAQTGAKLGVIVEAVEHLVPAVDKLAMQAHMSAEEAAYQAKVAAKAAASEAAEEEREARAALEATAAPEHGEEE